MGILSKLTFGLVGKPAEPPIEADLLWVIDAIEYVGPSPTKMSHTYVANLSRGTEKQQLSFSFRTTKKLDKLQQFVQSSVDRLNEQA